MVVLLEGSPISTEKHWSAVRGDGRSSIRVTIGFFVTSLSKALFPRLLSLTERPALGRVLVVTDFFHLRMMDATVFLGTFCHPSPDLCLDTILSRNSKDNAFDLMACFFALTCTVNYGTLYRQVCAFPNHVLSIEYTTGGLQSSYRNISRIINGNRMHLSSISSLIAKGLNTYVNVVFQFDIFNTFAHIS